MLMHYFVAGLRKFSWDDALLFSSDDFIKRARDSLTGLVLRDLERLFAFKSIALDANKNYSLRSQQIWWNYWDKLACDAESNFLQNLASELQSFYFNLALLFTDANDLKSKLSITKNLHLNFLEKKGLNELKHSIESMPPLTREKQIVLLTVRLAEEMAHQDIFSFDQIILYLYKILMKERLDAFNKDRGQIIFDSFVENIMESLHV
jgi:hypothetical protein